jgi:WW domain-binding protein 2
VQPVPGGNIPSHIPALEVKMTFKEGGAFDFHSTYERIKERMQQVVDIARESGALTASGEDGRADLAGVNLDAVHLDELPAYEDASRSPLLGGRLPSHPVETERTRQPIRSLETAAESAGEGMSSEPPRYEEVQRESVADELERQLRRQS